MPVPNAKEFVVLLQKIEKGELEEVISEGEASTPQVCYGKQCTANEHCCPGHACVDVDGGKLDET